MTTSDVAEIVESELAEPEFQHRPSAAGEASPTPQPVPQEAPRRFDRTFHVVWLCISAGVLLLSMLMQVRDSQQVTIPFTSLPVPELCTFRRFTGMDCAGCGMTRCFISLGHGDVAGAWNYNPAGILLYAIVLFQIPFRAWQLWRNSRGQAPLHLGRLGYGAMIVFAALMIAQWVIKQAVLLF